MVELLIAMSLLVIAIVPVCTWPVPGTSIWATASHGATIAGTVYAPSANITDNGCKMFLTGALVVGPTLAAAAPT